jgi:hypothetical protein
MGVGNRSTRRKPPTCCQSLTNCNVTNNLIPNIAAIPDIVFQFLTFDTNGQHYTWLYDKRDECSFTITHFPQNSIIPTAPRMEFNFHTSTPTLEPAVYILTFFNVFCVLNYYIKNV